MSEFSERITDIMEQRHITQKELANMANVTESAMSYYVNGQRTPRIQVISRLAGVLGVTTDYLLGAESQSNKDESQIQYLQRNLEKLDQKQLDKAETILKAVFEDVFDERIELPVRPELSSEVDFLYKNDAEAAKMPFILKSYMDIKEIDNTGITFTDGSKIDFEECCSNYRSDNKCVAARDYFADPPFIEFLTSDRPTRVVFCSSKSLFFKKSRSKDEFNEVIRTIKAYGYRTYDLG